MSDPPAGRPTVVVVTGPGGVGKTTLSRLLADRLGLPLVSRDALKQGMVASSPGFVPAASDPLTVQTYGLFFTVLELLVGHRVSHVAEAAFQHHNWVPRLEPLLDRADVRIIRCRAAPSIRRQRAERRAAEDVHRAAHDDAGYFAAAAHFEPVRMDVPTLDVATADGYAPELAAILDFTGSNR